MVYRAYIYYKLLNKHNFVGMLHAIISLVVKKSWLMGYYTVEYIRSEMKEP